MAIQQFGRKAGLFVIKPATNGSAAADFANATPQKTLDLSNLHFQFQTKNQDEEGPSNCSIRIFNLKQETAELMVKYGYSQVVVQAGYEGSYGVVFQGNIKQFRIGRLNQTDSYVDILAADGDLVYAFGFINKTLSAEQNNPAGIKAAFNETAQKYRASMGPDLTESVGAAGGTLPRGKVMFGMLRAQLYDYANSRLATWSIQDGKIQIIPLKGYLKDQPVFLSERTGMIGVPEQTQDGIKIRCLINPRIIVGGRVTIDNKSINQTINQSPFSPQLPNAGIPFDKWVGVVQLANPARDGDYRVYAVEHHGDTRGQDWYSDLICLAVDNSSGNVSPYGE